MKMSFIFGMIVCIAFSFASIETQAQSDGCSAATAIPITVNCSSPVSGTTAGATQTIAGCVGTADDDVWYTFTATATSHIITVTPSSGMDAVVQLFSGDCAALISMNCMDQGFTGEAETIYATGLTIGAVYKIRIYHYYTGYGSGTFTTCITTAPPAPSNDNCSGASLLNVNATCVSTAGTTVSATQSQPGCAGTADDDVWYRFVATNAVQTIQVTPSGTADLVLELFSGSCSVLTSLYCVDNGFSGDAETISAVGLIPGTTYYVRTYDYYSGNGGTTFDICIIGTPTPTPTNDEPCDAIQLPPVTSSCDYLSFTTTGATTTTSAPTPASCAGGSSPMQGGFNNIPQPKDVWFAITVPSSGIISIMAKPGYGFSDAVMALYSGTCTSLTQIACSDDNNYPLTANDFKPFLLASGLTPGTTVYLRYWAFNGNTTGDFGFCVTTPINDACSTALYICDLNGYKGTTGEAYTPDRPGNMRGNAETNNPPLYTYTAGTCQGGIFGAGGVWGTGAPNCDVQINNNSWVRFTAANDSAVLNVDVYDCYSGTVAGIQMQVFSAGSACADFTPVSNFEEGATHIEITARGLTVGSDYYLMIDGFAGDICNYTISAESGVQFPNITAAQDPICAGNSTTLFGPPGATAYHWYPGNETTQNITVNPATTMTYNLEVTGVCGYRQYLDYTLDVNQLPIATASSNSPECAGSTLNLFGSGGTIYQWTGPNGFSSTSASPSINNISSAAAGTYNLTVTSAAGCSSSTTTTVLVNPNPTANAGVSQTIPFGTSTTLSGSASGGSGTYLYSWSPAGLLVSSNIASPTTTNLTTTTVFTLTVTDQTTGCTSTAQTTVNVSGGALTVNALASAPGVCAGNGITLTALASGGSGSYTYSWSSNPSGFSSSDDNPYHIPSGTASYTVTVSDGFNSATSTINVIVYPQPTATASNTGPYCAGENIQLSASGGGTYSWVGPNGFSSSLANPVITSSAAVNNGTYTVIVTSAEGCTDSETTNVIINDIPVATANNNGPYCSGETVNLSASGGLSYAWSGPAGFSSSAANPAITAATPAVSGTYSVVVSGTGGCTATASTSVLINPLPSVICSNGGPYCTGETIMLSASGASDYSWAGPAGFSSNSQTPEITNAQLSHTGTYSVVGTDLNGCMNAATTTVNVNQSPEINISGETEVCQDGTAVLSANGANLYIWNTGATTASITIGGIASATYVVTGTTGTCSDIDSISVTVNPNPTANAGADTTIEEGQSIQLNGSGGGTYSWSPPDGLSDPDIANPICNAEDTTVYILTVTNEFGCTDTDTVIVRVDGDCGSIYVPNAFSPNGDGKNDVFGVMNRCLETLNLKVYNQWGNLVFETNDPNGRWDGTFSGTMSESGIYSYWFDGSLSDGTLVNGQGNFVLIR
ncbi:MAG TPA: gliding motility-associated C-terminal domain-containing protein [Bacteroidales bacterium]|nr:gliding motility-associated C-terminal domain-containing protein [Bacteroidales bacterium]